MAENSFDCLVTCSGLYSDIEFEASTDNLEIEDEGVRDKFFKLIDEYKNYKERFVRNIVFDPKSKNSGKKTFCEMMNK